MKNKLLFVLFVCNALSLFAQNVEWATSEPYSSYVTRVSCVVHDNFGNTFISGEYNIGNNIGIFIVKYDSTGTKLWEKNYSGAGKDPDLCTDVSGNLYTTFSAMSVEGASYNPNSDGLFAKYDLNGNMLWIKMIRMFMRLSERTDAQNNIIMTGAVVDTVNLGNGFVLSVPPEEDRLFIAKFNTNGECTWAQQNDGGQYPLLCTPNGDMFAKADLNGHSVTVGQGSSLVTLDPANGEQYIARYNSAGALLWVKQVYTCGIAADNEGNLYNLEPDRSNIPQYSYRNMYLTKYGPNGNVLWTRTHLFAYDWYKFAMKCGANGNLYITGGFSNYMTIDSNTINSGGSLRAFVAKIDSSGTFKWITVSSGAGAAGAKDISIANGNEIYITGDMGSGESTFGNYTLTQPNGGVFVAKIIDNDSNNVITAINDLAVSENSLSVYPNPSNTIFTITYQSTIPSTISFSAADSNGKLIFFDNQKQFSGQYLKIIDLSNQPKGVYFIEIICDGKRKSKKIMLQ